MKRVIKEVSKPKEKSRGGVKCPALIGPRTNLHVHRQLYVWCHIICQLAKCCETCLYGEPVLLIPYSVHILALIPLVRVRSSCSECTERNYSVVSWYLKPTQGTYEATSSEISMLQVCLSSWIKTLGKFVERKVAASTKRLTACRRRDDYLERQRILGAFGLVVGRDIS